MNIIMDHPLIKDKLTRMRKTSTPSALFNLNLKELAQLMIYEATKNLPVKEIEIETPVCSSAIGYKLANRITLVPILRAGVGMVDGLRTLMPASSVGFLGFFRDEETLKPIQYYCKMPVDIAETNVFILDPMLATGGTLVAAIDLIKTYKPKSITYIGIVGCPEGLKIVNDAHPDVDVYLAACDSRLNEKGYIIPGLGDAGDRIFGTK